MAAEKRTAAVSELEERVEPAKVTKTGTDQKEQPKAAEQADAAEIESKPAAGNEAKQSDAANSQEPAAEKGKSAGEVAAETEPATEKAAPPEENGSAVPDKSQAEAPTEPVADPEVKNKPAVAAAADEPNPTAQEA